MRFTIRKALASSVALAAIVGGGVVGVAGTASAAGALPDISADGKLTVTKAPGEGTGLSGNQFTRLRLQTDAPCGAGTTNFFIQTFGGNLPDDGYLMQTGISGFGLGDLNTVGFNIPRNYEEVYLAAGVQPKAGPFIIQLVCQDDFSTPLGTFSARLTFTTPTEFTIDAPVVAAAPSTTTLGASPASPQIAGTSVTFTATVASTGTVAGGVVTFKDGATTLGTGTVDATGKATLSTSALAAGSRSIVASFAGVTGQSAASDSAALSYSVTATPAAPTTTTLTAPSTAVAGDVITLNATVSPAAAAGQVEFFSDGVSLGKSTVTAGAASLSKPAPAAGSHSLTATFLPTNVESYQSSTSAAVALSTTAPTTAPDVQTIVGTIPAGTIVITTPYTATSPLDLGTLSLNANATLFSGSAAFQNISVTDTRAGNLPWTASALASDLSSGANAINGQNVGLTNLVPVYFAGNALQSVQVFDNAAAAGVAATDPGSVGLGGVPHKVASAANGAGTVAINGQLTLNAPTSTPAGLYTGTVTFTVVGS